MSISSPCCTPLHTPWFTTVHPKVTKTLALVHPAHSDFTHRIFYPVHGHGRRLSTPGFPVTEVAGLATQPLPPDAVRSIRDDSVLCEKLYALCHYSQKTLTQPTCTCTTWLWKPGLASTRERCFTSPLGPPVGCPHQRLWPEFVIGPKRCTCRIATHPNYTYVLTLKCPVEIYHA